MLHAIPGLRHCWCVRRLVRTQDTNGHLGLGGGTNFALTGELIDDNCLQGTLINGVVGAGLMRGGGNSNGGGFDLIRKIRIRCINTQVLV